MFSMLTMKKILLIALLLTSCKTENKKEEDMASSEKSIVYPYEFVDVRKETAGLNDNKMELYAYNKDIDLDNLRQLCLSKKQSFQEGTFYFLVLFDEKENAGFSKYPLTSSYGDDEDHLKHIRAYYSYNRLNGYSKLEIYETNKWESIAKEYDI